MTEDPLELKALALRYVAESNLVAAAKVRRRLFAVVCDRQRLRQDDEAALGALRVVSNAIKAANIG